MAYPQGAVVIASDLFGDNPKRPYLVASNQELPFHGEEYVAAAITTTERPEAVELTGDRIVDGRLPRTSYVSPWTVVTLKHWQIDKQPALATDGTVDEVRRELRYYLET
jgi:mRNA-degrading endonuclease toxin of MazEF toxin-antitoxin module